MIILRQSYVYMLINRNRTVLYIGVTAELRRRIWQYRQGTAEGFTKRYSLTRLVWFETFEDISNAIAREKELKGWTRARKNALVNAQNPHWDDLAVDWF